MSSVSPTSTAVPESITGPVALAGAPRPAGAPKPKPRKRVNTAEKRHQHNAIERQRRETLNGKFLVLARLLPSLAACRRPSKSAIVNGSISHLSHQREQRLLASKLLRQLAAEREELINEVNQWRQANGCQPKPAGQWTDEMEEIVQVEKEKFGTFSNVDGGDDDQPEDDEDMAPSTGSFDSMNIETANLVAGSFSTGLATPRSSTDMGSTLPMNGFSWSGSTFTMAAAPTVPFNAFMSEASNETSPLPSPVGSSGPMLTPTSAVDPVNVFTHTPSPRSAGSPEEQTPAASSPAQQWSSQQLAMFQQQVEHQRQQALAALQPQAMFMNQQLPQQAGLAQLMATMFPQRDLASASSEQMDQWRKLALGGLVQQDVKHNNFGFGGLINGWTEQAVGV